MPDIQVPGQRKDGDPPKAESLEDWGTLNTKANRPAIAQGEFAWNENWMPVGKGNLRTLYAEGSATYTATGSLTIILHFPYNLGTTSYVAIFLSDGSAVQVAVATFVATTIGAAGTFYSTGGDLPACSQYESKYLLIASTVATSAYWAWDGTSLYGSGTLAPQVTVTNSGTGYTGAPTVTAFGGSGSGATFSATVSEGSVSLINITDPGSGYVLGDNVRLIVSGGGSDTQARAHATVDSTQGGVGEVNLTAGGSSYTNDVHITFSGGAGTGAAAVVSSSSNGVLTSITVTNPGSGYTSAPTVTFVATGGSGATAVANVVRGQITALTVDDGGSGYTGAPQVVITPPDDDIFPTIQAVATALVSGGVVTGFTITSPGAGYTNAGIDLLGGNNAANASTTIMPFGLQATAIETYNDSVWTSVGTKMTFSSPGSVSNFSTVKGGGSSPATDAFLRDRIVALRQANGFLYRLADSSINVVSNVQTSASGITTFSNQNVDSQIGTAWRDSVVAFGRAIVFANPNGVYALYGGAAEKVSDALDGLFAKATFNIGGSGVIPTAAVATLFGIRVYMLLFTTVDPFTNTKRNIVAMWDGQKWFCATQLAVLTSISPEEIDSILTAWGSDGTHLYRMFQTPSSDLQKVFQTKLNLSDGPHLYKQANRGYLVAENNASAEAMIDMSIDNEQGLGAANVVSVSQFLRFVGSGPIQFIGAGGANLNFTVGGLQISGFQTSAYGRMLGWTVTTNATDVTVISLTMLYRDYAVYG
jgi:hypothetical protein